MRVVFDTNVFISAFVIPASQGERACLLAQQRRFELCTSVAILTEALARYATQDPEYKALKDEISNLQKQLKTNEDTSSLFSRLKERLSAFLKRQSTGKQSRQVESQRQKSEREKRAA